MANYGFLKRVNIFSLKKHFPLALMLAVLSQVTSCSRSEMILYEDRIGEMPLYHRMNLSVESMQETFKPYMVRKKLGQQDGPNFSYYEVSENSAVHFWIKTLDEDERLLDKVCIISNTIVDEYGVSVGTPYKEIKERRPAINMETDYHFHTIVYVNGSNIAYEIAGDFEGPDRQDFTEKEVENWVVKNIVWIGLDG